MYNRIAKGISILLHPVFVPSYLIIALKLLAPLPLFYLFFGNKIFLALWVMVFVYTALIPFLLVYLLYRSKYVSDITLSVRKERPKVYLLVSGFYVALGYFLQSRGNVFLPTSVIIYTMAVNIIGLFLFSFFDKISAHLAGLGGAIGIFFGIFYRYGEKNLIPVLLILIVITAITASARLSLGAHNLRQVTLGSIWGAVVGFIGTYYFMHL